MSEADALRQQLAQAEARFRAIIERNADAIIVIDEGGVVRFANRVAAQLFARDHSALIGTDFGFPMLAGETTELDLPRADGARVVEMRVVESEWEGHPALIASLRDITERKEAEAAARHLFEEQAARAAAEQAAKRFRFLADCSRRLSSSLDYQAVIDALPQLCVDGIADWAILYVVNDDGRVERLQVAHRDASKQEQIRALRDMPFEPTEEHPVMQVLREREPVLARRIQPGVLDSYSTTEGYVDLVRQLGITSYMIVPMIARGRAMGAIALVASDPAREFGDDDIALARDLALRAALALDNARLYRVAQEANQAKTDFLAVISHDLRTPLSSILGYSELLLMGVPEALSDVSAEQVRRVRTAGNHLLYLIDELLAYARLDAGRESANPRAIDAREVVQDVAGVIKPLAESRGLQLHATLPARPITCHSDPDKLRQILTNLAWNAIKFTEEGEVWLAVAEQGGQVRFRVQDTGVGIAPEHLDHIFQPFWQVREGRRGPEDGTGLGLSVVQRLTEMLGGHVGVESRPGEGSTFTVSIPGAAEHGPAVARAQTEPGSARAG